MLRLAAALAMTASHAGAVPATSTLETRVAAGYEWVAEQQQLVGNSISPTSDGENFGTYQHIQCAADNINPNSCVLTAPSAGVYYFSFSGSGTNIFTAVSSSSFSARIGPFPGVFYTTCCVINGVPGQECDWSGVRSVQYDNTCTGSPLGYGRSLSMRVVVAGQAQITMVTASTGLMVPQPTLANPADIAVANDRDFQIRLAVARQAMATESTASNSTLSVFSEAPDGQQIAIMNRVACASVGALNPRECTFTAPSGGSYYFVWSGDGNSHFTVVAGTTISLAEVGSRPGRVWNPSSCCNGACSWSNTNTISYSGTCRDSSYPTSSLRISMSVGQTVILVTASDGLM